MKKLIDKELNEMSWKEYSDDWNLEVSEIDGIANEIDELIKETTKPKVEEKSEPLK